MREAIWVAGTVILLLGGCSKPTERPDQTPESDRAVAQVEAANGALPPQRRITPQPITFVEMQKYNLHGDGCTFMRDGQGMAADAIAFKDRAVMMIDGNAATFAADTGAAKLPLGARSHYVGKGLSLSLTRLGLATEGERFPAKLVVADPQGRPVFEAEGDARCAPL